MNTHAVAVATSEVFYERRDAAARVKLLYVQGEPARAEIAAILFDHKNGNQEKGIKAIARGGFKPWVTGQCCLPYETARNYMREVRQKGQLWPLAADQKPRRKTAAAHAVTVVAAVAAEATGAVDDEDFQPPAKPGATIRPGHEAEIYQRPAYVSRAVRDAANVDKFAKVLRLCELDVSHWSAATLRGMGGAEFARLVESIDSLQETLMHTKSIRNK